MDEVPSIEHQLAVQDGFGDHVSLVAGAHLISRVFNVSLHRPVGDPEGRRNLFGGLPTSDVLKNLPFTQSQMRRIILLAQMNHLPPH